MDVGGIKLLKHAICVPGAAAPFKSHALCNQDLNRPLVKMDDINMKHG